MQNLVPRDRVCMTKPWSDLSEGELSSTYSPHRAPGKSVILKSGQGVVGSAGLVLTALRGDWPRVRVPWSFNSNGQCLR